MFQSVQSSYCIIVLCCAQHSLLLCPVCRGMLRVRNDCFDNAAMQQMHKQS